MSDSIDKLLTHPQVAKGGPASESAISEILERFGGVLPTPLLKLWRAGEGVHLDTLHAHIPGPTEVIEILDCGMWNILFKRGCIPLLYDHESNFLALFAHPPLAFRIAYVPHDDGSRLIYRNLTSFADALLGLLDSGGSADDFYKAAGDYPPATSRPIEDQQAAIALMKTDGENEEWNYAAQLLDASNLEQWETLIETDHFVRRDVIRRLRQMKEPGVQALLARQKQEFQTFALAVADAARRAGFVVGERQDGSLQIGRANYILEGFFYRRKVANAIPRLLLWFEDQAEGKNPHHRPGNFMADP